MKRICLYVLAVCGMVMSQACQDVSNQMDPDYPADYDINYALKTVTEIDPVNVSGIDVYPYFDFFKTFRFTIHVKGGKMSSISVDNGEVPFSPFSFDTSAGEIEVWFDSQSSPNALRLKDTGEAIAYFTSGELYVPFSLDCVQLSYEYRFREIAE